MPIWKTKYGWRTRIEHHGGKVFGPTFKYKAEAQVWCQAEKERLKKETFSPSTSPNLSLWELAQKHLDDVQVTLTKKTYDEKRFCLQRFVQAVGDRPPVEITTPEVAEFLNRRAREASSNASNKDRKNIKAFYRWLQDYYGIMYDPTAPIRQKPHQRKGRRLIPIGNMLKVIMAAPMPERALIASYWHTGARRGEVLRWTWAEDVNLEGRWVRLGTKKNRDGSMVYERLPMNNDLHGLLSQLWKARDKTSPYVFPDYFQPQEGGTNWKGEQRAHRFLSRICAEAEVDSFGYHDIRHTVAKYLNDVQKVGLKKVQQILRHRRQTTTEIYLEGNYTDMQEALGSLEFESVSKSSQKSSQKESKGINLKG